jgi:hypothetical protein
MYFRYVSEKYNNKGIILNFKEQFKQIKFLGFIFLLFTILVMQIPIYFPLAFAAPVLYEGYGFQLVVPNDWYRYGNDIRIMMYASFDRSEAIHVMMFSPGSWTLNDFANSAYNLLVNSGINPNSIAVAQTSSGFYPAVVLTFPNGFLQYTAGNTLIYQVYYIGAGNPHNKIQFGVVNPLQQINQQQMSIINWQILMQGSHDAYTTMMNAITCWTACTWVWK